MLVLKNINKTFGNRKVLKNLSIEFRSGLNFIVGPSGSGKSTLLKILSAMDKEYDGSVFYKGNNIKEFNAEELNSYYYNSVGFVWQNFQLINHLSVEDNVGLVLQLSNLSNQEKDKKVISILRKLGIEKLAKQNISKLSGGQKQRVAIARALVKDPEIIIADEPTGALDKKSSSIIMNILKQVAKERIVIVVTHDKSFIDDDSNSFLLNDGVISQISSKSKEKSNTQKSKLIKPNLSIGRASRLGIKNLRGMFIKFILTSLVLSLSSYFLLLNFSGTVGNEQQEILNELIDKKGDMLRDLSVVTSAISAGSTGDEDGNRPNVDIKQDVSSVLDKYKDDNRIEHLMPIQPISNMNVNIDGITKDYKVENSNNVPIMNKVVAGRMPNLSGREVAVSELLVKNLNLAPEDIIGKTISVSGTEFDWSSGEPKEVNVEIKDLSIVGVVNTSIKYESPYGEDFEVEFEDSFIYSFDVVKEIKKQANASDKNISFSMRVKEIGDVLSIVDELNKEGITAMGEFESVRDILSIDNTTKEQSTSLNIIISFIAVIVTLAITIINSYIRRTEYAILKINGYSNKSIFNLNIMEYLLISIFSIIIFVPSLPIINSISSKILSMSISGSKAIFLGIAIILVQGIIMGIISSVIVSNMKTSKGLMAGDR